VSTDAGGEGLNLQFCHVIVNFDMPWNPMRVEQRIGRVDRIGQRRTVHAFHLIAGGTGESRLLTRLRARVASAQAEFGAPDPFVDDERRAARLVMTERE
jgi:SNF2 family DNA or RNA helicase